MPNKIVVFKDIADIESVLTGHGVGEKKVLLSQKEHSSPITQIAQTRLQFRQIVENHVHPTMDEHFVFLKGECKVRTDVDAIHCYAGQYLMIPAGVYHQIEVLSDTELITIGVTTE